MLLPTLRIDHSKNGHVRFVLNGVPLEGLMSFTLEGKAPQEYVFKPVISVTLDDLSDHLGSDVLQNIERPETDLGSS